MRVLVLLALLLLPMLAQAQTPPIPPPISTIGGNNTLAVTTSTARIVLPADVKTYPAVLLYNDGLNQVFVTLGASGVVATSGSIPLSPGGCMAVWTAPANGYVAAITAGGTSTLRIMQFSGNPTYPCAPAPGAVIPPTPMMPYASATTDASGTITTGGAFQVVQTANPNRKFWEFINLCSVSGACSSISNVCYLFVGSGSPNKLTNAIPLLPGAGYRESTGSIASDQIRATCDGTGDHFKYHER